MILWYFDEGNVRVNAIQLCISIKKPLKQNGHYKREQKSNDTNDNGMKIKMCTKCNKHDEMNDNNFEKHRKKWQTKDRKPITHAVCNAHPLGHSQ